MAHTISQKALLSDCERAVPTEAIAACYTVIMWFARQAGLNHAATLRTNPKDVKSCFKPVVDSQ